MRVPRTARETTTPPIDNTAATDAWKWRQDALRCELFTTFELANCANGGNAIMYFTLACVRQRRNGYRPSASRRPRSETGQKHRRGDVVLDRCRDARGPSAPRELDPHDSRTRQITQRARIEFRSSRTQNDGDRPTDRHGATIAAPAHADVTKPSQCRAEMRRDAPVLGRPRGSPSRRPPAPDSTRTCRSSCRGCSAASPAAAPSR